MDFEELYDNLDVELHNLSIRLTKNVFHSEANNQVDVFINDFKGLIHQFQFNLDLERVVSLPSYAKLIDDTADESKDYLVSSIEKFYLNTTKGQLEKIKWLNDQNKSNPYSTLQLQKFLFFYEMFQYSDKKEFDFNSLKAYKNGPVYSTFYDDYKYRADEVNHFLETSTITHTIDEENALASKFLIETMTDTELSQLTHEFDMWKVHQSEIDSEVQHIPMDEKDISDDDIELLEFIKYSVPSYDYEVINLKEKRFVFTKEDFALLNEQHWEVLDTLSEYEELNNPVYIEVDKNGRLLVD